MFAGAAHALASCDRWDEAERMAQMAVDSDAEFAFEPELRVRPLIVLAEACARNGRDDEADAWVEHLDRIAPTSSRTPR